MRNPIRLLVLAALCLFACASAHAEKWALLIGINHYEDANNIASLGAADNDARKLKMLLRDKMGVPDANITLLVSDGDTKPTRSNIIEALGNLSVNAKKDDTVFVFYSGHGVELAGKSCLLPYDFRGRLAFTGIETALEVNRFKELLGAVKARALVMVWDMCRNDPFSKGKGTGKERQKMAATRGWSIGPTGAARTVEAPIIANLFACSPGECSFEWADKNRGYFAYFLEQGLRGDAADAQGNITIGSLAKYVRSQVIATTTRNEGAAQSPLPELTGPDAQDFVLSTGNAAIIQPTITPKPGSVTINVTASLDVKANVAGAKVSIDKKPLDGTHFETELRDKESADFMVVVTAGGYRPSISRVTLVRGKNLVHPVTLEKRPTPVKVPTPTVKAPATAAELAGRVLAAHHWAEFQKLTSIKLSGTARATGSDTDPEDMKAFTITLTPAGDYRMSWLDSSGRNDAGGTAQTSWSRLNGVLLPEVIGAKSMLFPQGVLGVVAAALQSAPERWSMGNANGGRLLELSVADASGSMKVLVDPTTYRVGSVMLTVPTTTGVDIRVVCNISSYEMKQGIPIPSKITSGIFTGKEKMSVSHSYSNIEINVPLKPGFNEAK